jgi:hypothetical protein
MGEMRNVYKGCLGKFSEKRPLATPGHIYEDNIKMGYEDMDWIRTAQNKCSGGPEVPSQEGLRSMEFVNHSLISSHPPAHILCTQ